jgi:hypothetical protein
MTRVDNRTLKRQLFAHGYILLTGVISADQVTHMRERCDEFFADDRTHMFTKDFLRFPELAAVPFGSQVTSAIRQVLGEDYATITQFSLTANLHSPAWHRDSQSAGDQAYLWDADYLVFKCGVYLQDNDPEWGGGMEIVPGSHRPGILGHQSPFPEDSFMTKPVRKFQRFLRDRRDRRLKRLWLPLKAGDVLLFHANLLHRASQPTRAMSEKYRVIDPPHDKFKYMIQWELSANNRYLPVYLTHQATRQAAPHRQGLYRESFDARFPDDYPPEVVSEINRADIRVANYSDIDTADREGI